MMITKKDIEQSVVNILRDVSMGRPDQKIAMDQSIGKQELGLDSLGLIEFVAALEKKFSVEVPDSIWKAGGRLSPSDFVKIIMELHPLPTENKESLPAEPSPPLAASASYTERLSAAVHQRGLLAASRWALERLSRRFVRSLYATEVRVILRHDLDPIPDYRAFSRANLQFREIFKADRASLESLWAPHLRSKELRNFDKHLDSGIICLTAWRGVEIVGIDYLSSACGRDPDTGLMVKTLPGSGYAIGLYEKYPGEGIGSALLGYSLSETKKRGFQRQVTFVNEENVKMLISTIQLFGFKEVGRIRSRRWLGKVSSEWFIADQPQPGRTIVI